MSVEIAANVGADTTTSGTAVTGFCTIEVPENAEWGNCSAELQWARADTAATYRTIHRFSLPDPFNVLIYGTYYLRIKTTGGDASTDLTFYANQ